MIFYFALTEWKSAITRERVSNVCAPLGLCFQHSCQKRAVLRIKFEIISSTIFPPGFSTFKNVRDLRKRLSRVRDDHIWLLETGTPIPEEFQVINDRHAHVKILPSEHASVTVEKFQEVFITIYLLKYYNYEKINCTIL